MATQGQRFAQVVLAALRANGLMTSTEIERAGGPSSTTVSKLRLAADGAIDLPQPKNPTWHKVDTAAGWEAGTAVKVWNGEDPPALDPDDYKDARRPEEDAQAIDILAEMCRIGAEAGIRMVIAGGDKRLSMAYFEDSLNRLEEAVALAEDKAAMDDYLDRTPFSRIEPTRKQWARIRQLIGVGHDPMPPASS